MKDVSKIYTTLLEKFGEPIGKQKATVGAADNGPQGKALWNDEPKKDREWSDPTVIDEADKKKKSKKKVSAKKKPKNEAFMPATVDECCGKMPESIDEAPMAPDDFDNYDRTGNEDMQRKMTTPEAVAGVVKDWFTRHGGKIDRPDTGNRTPLGEITEWCVDHITGSDEYDPVGSLWQIEEFLKQDWLHYEELSQALYALINGER